MRAVPFDADSLSVTGGSVPLLDRIMIKRTGAANLDISDNGRLVFARGTTVDPSAPQAVFPHPNAHSPTDVCVLLGAQLFE